MSKLQARSVVLCAVFAFVVTVVPFNVCYSSPKNSTEKYNPRNAINKAVKKRTPKPVGVRLPPSKAGRPPSEGRVRKKWRVVPTDPPPKPGQPAGNTENYDKYCGKTKKNGFTVFINPCSAAPGANMAELCKKGCKEVYKCNSAGKRALRYKCVPGGPAQSEEGPVHPDIEGIQDELSEIFGPE